MRKHLSHQQGFCCLPDFLSPLFHLLCHRLASFFCRCKGSQFFLKVPSSNVSFRLVSLLLTFLCDVLLRPSVRLRSLRAALLWADAGTKWCLDVVSDEPDIYCPFLFAIFQHNVILCCKRLFYSRLTAVTLNRLMSLCTSLGKTTCFYPPECRFGDAKRHSGQVKQVVLPMCVSMAASGQSWKRRRVPLFEMQDFYRNSFIIAQNNDIKRFNIIRVNNLFYNGL